MVQTINLGQKNYQNKSNTLKRTHFVSLSSELLKDCITFLTAKCSNRYTLSFLSSLTLVTEKSARPTKTHQRIR